MRKRILFILFTFSTIASLSQNDTTKIYNSSQLKKGFYKTYEEYLNNAPSLNPDVTITYFTRNKNDSNIISANYKLTDPHAKMPEIWGFCDGKDVFIQHQITMVKTRYPKAEYIGKYPFFIFWQKQIYAIGPPLLALATAAGTASMKASLDLMFVDQQGKIKEASYRNLKKFFTSDPELLKRFKEDNYISNKIIAKYLIEFNEKYITGD